MIGYLYLKSLLIGLLLVYLTISHAYGNLYSTIVLPWVSFMFASCAMHDAGHGVGHRVWRRAVLITSEWLGLAGTPRWIQKHNAHHSHTNTIQDPELHVHPWMNRPTTIPRLLIVYSCLHASLLIDHLTFQPSTVRGVVIERTRSKLVDAFQICAFACIRFGLPLYLGGGVRAILGEMLAGIPASLFISLLFQVSHSFEGVAHESQNVEDTTCDFARDSWIYTELFGALNHQVEHHKHPSKPHTTLHSPSAPKHTFSTFYSAIRSHFAYMTN
jgi:fatty acid desaturase